MLGLFILSPSIRLYAQVVPEKNLTDSLKNVLSNTPLDKDKIHVLKVLVNLYWQQPEEVMYLKDIVRIAGKEDSLETMFAAFTGICRYYYNEGAEDSLFCWKNKLDSLTNAMHMYPPAYFRAGNLICKKHLEEANYELAMNEALRLLNKAKETNQDFGMMCANLNLAQIYQAVRRDSDAVVAFREGLKWWDGNKERPTLLLQYLSDMLISTLRADSFEESETLLKRYEETFASEIKKSEQMGIVFPVQWHRWLIESYYVELYVRSNKLDKAEEHLVKVVQYIRSESDENMKFPYYQAVAMYCQKIKDHPRALEAIDKALQINEDPSLMKMKVDILRNIGKTNEALLVYDALLKINSEVSNNAFVRQMKQLRLLNDLNDEQKRSKEIEYQTKQIQTRQRLILFAFLFSLVLLSVFFFLNRYYRRTRRLKNELLHEKNMLVKSERQLQIAKAAAEKANQDKTAFIANISHEVRTPLNAIVGFSELLAEEKYEEEEKKEFASVINKSSEILMNLITDVLDLSRLESSNARLTFQPCDFVACCKDLLHELSDKVPAGVQLTSTSPFQSYEIETDSFRFRQLLTKLLLNAIKFTSRGEINLSYQIDEEKQEVRFLVTDTGCGIPIEKQKCIFERFEKLDDFMQGTGLGLPIGSMIAQKLGGSLLVDPEYVDGARFIFVHPLKNSYQNEKK